jgi:hypothetical protein
MLRMVPLPRCRGGGNSVPFPRRIAPESCSEWHESFRLQISEGRRSAGRRIVGMSATHSQALPSESASAAVARHTRRCCHLKVLRARSPLGAPRAVLAAQINATAQPRPRFMRTGGCGRYPHHRTHPQRSTSRTGHSAGRVDAQAARERSYKPRPQEPHSPYQSAVTGDIPSRARLNNDIRAHPQSQMFGERRAIVSMNEGVEKIADKPRDGVATFTPRRFATKCAKS